MAQDTPERDEMSGTSATLPAPPPDDTEVGDQPTLHAQSGVAQAAPATQPDADPHPLATQDWVGRVVRGRYRVLEKLGEGGMGVVYVAEHIHLKKKVAFKVIHPELAANEELLLRFTREALATGQLDHAHICAAIDFEKLDDSAFLVMPFVRGHSLQAEFDSHGALPWRTACRWGAQIADALSAAHAVGIIHRDLKPDNILIETLPDGSQAVKVLDFGVASLTGTSSSITGMSEAPLTQAGMILGTPGYMSPEQATAGDIDARTDLYALGVTLWELTAGRRLFDAPDVTRIFAQQFNSIPEPLTLGEVGPAREFSALVTALLAPQKEHRPQTAAEVRDTLRRLAEAPEPHVVQTATIVGWRRLKAQWEALTERERVILAAATVVVLGTLGFAMGGGEAEQPQTAEAGAETSVEAPRARAAEPVEHSRPRPEAAATTAPPLEDSPPEQAKDTPSLVTQVGKLFQGLPEPLAEARRELFEGKRARDRDAAARQVMDHDHPDEVPTYLRLAAELELARGCRAKRGVLRELTELADAEALPAVQRLDETPRRGCAPFNLRDCLACMRSDIAEALQTLND